MFKKITFLSILICFALSLAALPVIAENTTTPTSTPTSTPTIAPGLIKIKYDPVCIQNAIDKRDTAIITAHNVFNTAITKALEDRKIALKAAWGNTDRKARVKAIRDAWKNYQKTRIKAKKKLNADVSAAWKQYNLDKKKCKVSALDDLTGQSVDLN